MIRDTSGQDSAVGPTVKSRLVRWLLPALALAVVVAAGFGARSWFLSTRSVNASRIRTAKVHRGTLVRDIAANARVTAANSPTLYATTSGTIELFVTAGDPVKKGQPLISIDSPELKSKLAQETATRDQLEAELGRFNLRVEQARAAAESLVDQAKIDRQTASRELEQNQESFSHGVVPEVTMLRAKDALAKAEISLAHARKNLDLESKGLKFERRSTALHHERQAEVVREIARQVEALRMLSPVDGVVGQVTVSQRATVSIHDPLLTVVDLSALELEIQIPESFARELAIGMPTEIDVRGNKVAGRVRSVSPQVVNGEVAARIEFADAPPEGLRQNQRVGARIVIDEKPDVLMIDRGPSVDASRSTAYFVTGEIAEARPIRIGVAGLRNIEIISGAQVGDEIVISGADHFDDAPNIRLAND